ncbi:MAG: MFS transporter [Acidimicrobiia bacterium]|nr:MFS transporter [Acidimicrobiia bacterium]
MSKPRLGANYWKLWSASVVSNFGDGLAIVAYPWLASAVTRSPLHLAGIAVATRLPWAIFTLPAGVIADRVDRRKLIGWMNWFRFALTMVVAVAVTMGAGNVPDPADLAAGTASAPDHAALYLVLIYAASLLLGLAEVLGDNAAQTLMPSVVAPAHLERANGRLWGAEMVMNSFVGPPLAGLLIAAMLALPFYVDSATFAVAALLILSIRGDFRSNRTKTSVRTKIDWLGEIKEGVSWLWRHRVLRSLAIVLGLLNGLSMMSFSTYVFFVQEILGLSAPQFGLLLTAGAVGGVVGSMLGAVISARLGSGTSLFVAIGAMFLQAAVTGVTSSAIVVWVMFFIGTFWGVVWNVITVSLRQQIIPDDLLGRVNSVYRFFGWGMMPIGSLAGGLIVAGTEHVASRELALRMPFLIEALILLGILVAAMSRLNTSQIEAARAAAHSPGPVDSADPASSGADSSPSSA